MAVASTFESSSQGEEFDSMISYCDRVPDKQIAFKIRKRLGDMGYKVWIGTEQARSDVVKDMQRGVSTSRVIIGCVSQSYESSPACQKEYRAAHRQQKSFIPAVVQTDYMMAEEFKLLFGDLHKVNFENGTCFETSIEDLVKTLEAHSVFPSEKGNQYDVMLSYRHSDKTIVHPLRARLGDYGYNVWIDKEQIKYDIKDDMSEGIDRSKAIIGCLSDEYEKSKHCEMEFRAANRNGKIFIPIKVQRGYELGDDLSHLFGDRLYVDFGTDFDGAMGKLLQILQQNKIFPSMRTIDETTSSLRGLDIGC